MTTDDTSPFAAEPAPASASGSAKAEPPDAVPPTATDAERDDWRGPQDDPWQPDEQAPPPVIGD